jgi:hypothetical protein
MVINDYIGIIGSILLASSSLPEVYESVKRGYSGMSKGMMILWLLGVIFISTHIFIKHGISEWIVLLNYMFSLIMISIIIKYKWWPRCLPKK